MTNVHVLLFKDVPSVSGTAGEIVLVPSQLARKTLIPQNLGYYVPRQQGSPILPEGWKPKVVEKLVYEEILPAESEIPEEELSKASVIDREYFKEKDEQLQPEEIKQ